MSAPTGDEGARPQDDIAVFEGLAAAPREERWHFRLYVAGSTPRSTRALQAIKAVCEQLLAGRYELDVIDVFQEPGRAETDQVIAVPTLVKLAPAPVRRIIGDLANHERLLRALGLGAEVPS